MTDSTHCAVCATSFRDGEIVGGPWPLIFHQDMTVCCARRGWHICKRCEKRPTMVNHALCGPCENARVFEGWRYTPKREEAVS